MKREVLGHPKTRRLRRLLNERLYGAAGILECMWKFAGEHCPRGDIGRWSNEDIADHMEWPIDRCDQLVDGLISAGWLDPDDEHRLVIHDWPEHCEDSVHMRLARAGEFFADGSQPKTSRFSGKEKEEVERSLEKEKARSSHSRVHTARTQKRTDESSVHTACALPTPLPLPRSQQQQEHPLLAEVAPQPRLVTGGVVVDDLKASEFVAAANKAIGPDHPPSPKELPPAKELLETFGCETAYAAIAPAVSKLKAAKSGSVRFGGAKKFFRDACESIANAERKAAHAADETSRRNAEAERAERDAQALRELLARNAEAFALLSAPEQERRIRQVPTFIRDPSLRRDEAIRRFADEREQIAGIGHPTRAGPATASASQVC